MSDYDVIIETKYVIIIYARYKSTTLPLAYSFGETLIGIVL